MTATASFGRRLLIAVDVKGYGRSDDRRQERIQRYLALLLDTAASRAGLDRATWERQPAGDGELALLPITEAEPRVVDDYTRHLAHELRRLNEDVIPERRMRVRMAIHHGVAAPAEMGYSGQGVVVVSRLLDSAPLRAALYRAETAVLLSGTVYEDVVANGHTSIAPEQFTPVDVQVKELLTRAYLFLPGTHLPGDDKPSGSPDQPLAAPQTPTAMPDSAPAPAPVQTAPQVTNRIDGPVSIDFGVFGPYYGPRP